MENKDQRPPRPRIAGNAALGAMVTPIIVWWWNGFHPDLPQMSPEVSAAMGTIVGVLISYAVSWLPRPRKDHEGD